jgi:two-component system phosphate regulon sensor histidine kinase PhoR
MNKIFNKIFGIYLLVLVPLTGIILFIIFDIIHDHYINTIEIDLRNLNRIIQDQLYSDIVNNDLKQLNAKVKRIGRKTNSRITVIDIKGIVLADNEENPLKMENHAMRIEMSQALLGKMGTSIRFSTTVNKKMLYVALPLKLNGQVFAVVRVSVFIDYIDDLYSELRNKILLTIVIIMSIGLLILFFFSKNLTNPIKELVNASQKFSTGDLNAKVIIDNNDELKDLADNFNLMTEKIKELFEKQTMQQEELKRIIGSMQEGLIVLDKDNKIVLFNKSFKKTVDVSDIQDKYYWEILRDVSIQDLVDKVRRKKSHKTTEIKFNNIYYLCSANYIQTKDEIVIVLFDISERKQLEEMKRDFIVNASHELRTPLTAIKGFIETMEDEAEGNQVKYLEIIKRHTSRLISIVEDLLAISKLEDEKGGIQLSDIEFKKLLKDVTTIFEEQAKKKNIKIKTKIDDDVKPIKADAFKLEQLFINLIDNAIKYTPKGEIKISVKDEEDSIFIQISDTGMGIPENDLSRIFERFYTVDKSRARKNVGTGLGLSIVKHIVQLHGGQIDVTSKLGTGTAFNIRLPKEV